MMQEATVKSHTMRQQRSSIKTKTMVGRRADGPNDLHQVSDALGLESSSKVLFPCTTSGTDFQECHVPSAVTEW